MKEIKYIVLIWNGTDWKKSVQEYDSYEEAEAACEKAMFAPNEYKIETIEKFIKED